MSVRGFAQHNLDPALAEAIEAGPAHQQVIEAIVRLEDPGQIPPHFTVVSRFNRICTGRFLAAHAWTIRRHPNVISLKAARPLGIQNEGGDVADLVLPEMGAPTNPAATFTGRGCIVAALDFGLDFAHPAFLHPDGTTRLVAFWHQGAPYDPAHPNRFGYGREYSPEEINAALRTSDPYRALGYHPATSDTGRGCHGTHTLDIAAGNGRYGGGARLVFVNLSTPSLGAVGDLGTSVRLLEALHYVETTARGRPWVANLSVGRTAGSHDGTSLVEQGMHELLRLGPGRAIVQSAGNYRSAGLAVHGVLRDGEHRDLRWIIDPRDTTGNEVDAWYSGKDRLVVALRSPDGNELVTVRLGEVIDIRHEGDLVGRIYHRRNDPNNGDNHVEAFLYRNAPSGVWTLRLIGDYVISGRFHAWIERDLARAGAQSRFDATITSQSYTLGTIATSPLVITVGAYNANAKGRPLAPFSSCGPTRDERDDKPELLAPGVDVVAARSIPRGAARQEGLLVARSGTSMAAPHVTGAVAALFEAARRPLSIDEIRDCLRRSAETVEHSRCCAWGRLDADAAIRAIRGAPTSRNENLATHSHDAESFLEAEQASEVPLDEGSLMNSDATESLYAEEQDTDARMDETSLVYIDSTDSFLDRAEHALRSSDGGRRQSETSFLQRLLRELDGSVSVAGLSPAALFRAVLHDRPLMNHARNVLEVLAMPSQRPDGELHPGDWMLRAVPGTGDVGHVSVLASGDLLTPSALASEGIAAESLQPGHYGLVVEAGAFPHSRARPFARRLLDSRGRVPPHTMILRPKYPQVGAMADFPPDEPEPQMETDIRYQPLPDQPTSSEPGPGEDFTLHELEACKRKWLKFLDTFPTDVREALKNYGPELAVVVAIHHGVRDLERLTRLSFDAKYGGERGYCPIERSDTKYRKLKNDERVIVKNYLARPSPPLAQKGGVTCHKVERKIEAAKPDKPSASITGRYEHRYPDPADPKWTITNYTFNINQAGRHIEGHITQVLRPQDQAKDRFSTRFHGDLQTDGSFVVHSIARPDQLWGYLTYEQKGQNWHLYWQRMANDKNEPVGSKMTLRKISDSPTLMEWAFADQGFPRWGPVHLHERWPLTQAQIKHLATSFTEDKIAPMLQTYFTTPADNRVAQRNALIDAAAPLRRHVEAVFTHKYFGVHIYDMELARYYVANILSQNKWTFKQITRSQLDWIQIMLDVVSGYGFALPGVTNFLGLKPTVGPGQKPVDPTTKPHKYKVSYSLRGFLVYYRGTLTVEKTSGTTWKESFKITLKGLQAKPGFSISEEGEAETYHEWTDRDIPGSVELVTAKLGGSIPGVKATAGAWFMHIFGSRYLPYMDVLGAEVKAKANLDKKFKLDLVNLGGLWGEIYPKSLPDKDYSKFAPVTDYVADYKLQDDVHFCLGSSLLTEDARQALRIVCANELAGLMLPESTLRIVGHADRVDTDERNYQLSEMRAKNTLRAIQDVLGGSFKIPDDPAHITLEWKGEEEAAKAQPSGQKPDPRFRRVDVFLNSRLLISLKAG